MFKRGIVLKTIAQVPEKYLKEFREQQTRFIKSRVLLLCILAISIYFFAVILGFIVDPGESTALEIVIGFFLICGGGVLLYLNSRTKTLQIAKLNAYIFTAFLLILLVKMGIFYKDEAVISSALFVFTIFFISVTIPWTPKEVHIIGFMHVAAYTVNFFWVRILPGVSKEAFSMAEYFNGLIFLSMALILCVVLRRHETARDIENFVLLKEIEDKNEQMSKELEWATRIHKTIISGPISNDKVEIGVTYLPVYYIGGDYVKFEFIGKDKLIFIIGDVTGHGIPAALLVNRIHAEFERFAKEEKSPGVLMKELNEFIKEDFEGADMYLSGLCGLVDFKHMTLSYSNYGHPPQYVYSGQNEKIHSLPPQTSLLGLPMDDDNIYQNEVELDKGDRILLFTDGVTEAANKESEEYGKKRLEKFVAKNHTLSPEQFNGKLIEDVKSFNDGDFKDDICLLNMEIKTHLPLIHWPKHKHEGQA